MMRRSVEIYVLWQGGTWEALSTEVTEQEVDVMDDADVGELALQKVEDQCSTDPRFHKTAGVYHISELYRQE